MSSEQVSAYLVVTFNTTANPMNSFFKTIIAGYGAKKLGGGCLSTVVVFILIYWLLGTCN